MSAEGGHSYSAKQIEVGAEMDFISYTQPTQSSTFTTQLQDFRKQLLDDVKLLLATTTTPPNVLDEDEIQFISPSDIDDGNRYLPDDNTSETNSLPGRPPSEKKKKVNHDPDNFSDLLGCKEIENPKAADEANKINIFD